MDSTAVRRPVHLGLLVEEDRKNQRPQTTTVFYLELPLHVFFCNSDYPYHSYNPNGPQTVFYQILLSVAVHWGPILPPRSSDELLSAGFAITAKAVAMAQGTGRSPSSERWLGERIERG